MQGGLHAANSILRRQKGKPTNPFRYRDLGSVATIGRPRIVSVRGSGSAGSPAGWSGCSSTSAFLTGFGNRLTTMLRWLRSMIGRGTLEREFRRPTPAGT